MLKKKKFETRAVHVGNQADPETGSIAPSIHLTSTFKQDAPGEHRGFDYSRAANPTRKRFEENIASLEEGEYGIAFSSGMAASTALFHTLYSGDHIIVGRNVYGGTYRMAVNVLSNLGLKFDFVDTRDLDQINDTIHANTKWIFVETPTNPLLELTDINALSNLCNENGIKLAVDNTFMSPYGQNPLSLGADVVLHSATKLIGGHSDVINGVLITNDKTMADKLYFIQKSGGAVPSPFDCWLLLRSTKTLGLRVQRQSDNAMELAKQLESQPMVHTVIYPGLKSHSQYDLAKTQQLNPNGAPIFGSLISIKLGSTKKRDLFLSKVKLFTLAESLGGVESLVCIPYNMTHGAVPSRMKAEMGLTEDLIRLSIGIEHFDDLYSDLTLALQE